MGDIAELYNEYVDPDDWEGPIAVCKFCGSQDVYWEFHRGKWVMHQLTDGKTHNCRAVAPATDFDVL